MNLAKKTDSDLEKAVVDEISRIPAVNDAHIGVAVTRGIVTLSGAVDTDSERLRAKEAALSVRGVAAVADEITVRVRGRAVGDNLIARQARGGSLHATLSPVRIR